MIIIIIWKLAKQIRYILGLQQNADEVNRKCPPRNTTVQLWTP